MNRELPSDPVAERAVLGAIIDQNEFLYDVQAVIRPDDFQLESNRRIYRRILDLDSNAEHFNLITLANALKTKGELESVGGHAYISELTTGVPRSLKPLLSQVRVLREKSVRRRLIGTLESAGAQAWDATTTTKTCLQSVEESLFQIMAEGPSEGPVEVSQFAHEVYNNLLEMQARPRTLAGLTTSLPQLDVETTGYRDGQFTIVGGWPGSGKSSLALQAIAANAREGIPVGLFSLEMTREECTLRLVSKESDVFYYKLHDPKKLVEKYDQDRVKQAFDFVAEWPLHIDDASSLSITEIVARAKLLIRRKGVKLIVVDYLQIVDGEGRDERMRLTKISKALRQLAKHEKVPVIGLSQLTRPKDADPNARPNKFHLKESGSLEADAHNIFLLYREYSKQDKKLTGLDEIIIAKQRNGPTSSVPVQYAGTTLTYEERV